jgi:hypothetical protein
MHCLCRQWKPELHDKDGLHSVFTLLSLLPGEAKIACLRDEISDRTKYNK